MKNFLCLLAFLLFSICGILANAQTKILQAPPEKRLALLWLHCTTELISDKDSAIVHAFLDSVIAGAEGLKDRQLEAYAQYFKLCWRILFSAHYEWHFLPGDYQSAVNILLRTEAWAITNNHPDIAASCHQYIGEVYYRANRYGLAFEHLFKANASFKKIGYRHVPNIANYLYLLGLHLYQFEEFDKALEILLEAAKQEFYLPRTELNTLNAIGLIYVRKHENEKAIPSFRNTINKAAIYHDSAWIGIGAGNLGNVYLAENKDDSALYYHRRNFSINGSPSSNAPEDAAKSAISLANVFLRKGRQDSALYYLKKGDVMAHTYIVDTTEMLDFRKRLLTVMIQYAKTRDDYGYALRLTDSLIFTDDKLRARLDNKVLNRAMEKTEAALYESRLNLLKSQKDLVQVRIYFVLAVIFIPLISFVFIFRDKWLNKKRQMEFAEKDHRILLVEKLRAEEGLKHSEELLRAYVDMVKEKTILIEHLESELIDIKKDGPKIESITANREKLRASTILTDEDWQQFRTLFEQVYPGFSYRLKENYPELSPAENRLLFLTKLKLSSREMAAMLGISIYAIHKLRYRVRKKINLDEEASFDDVLQKIS